MWLRDSGTVDFLTLWENKHNEKFLPISVELNTLTPKIWIKATNSIGIASRQGKNAGTYAHKEIAMHFMCWLSADMMLNVRKTRPKCDVPFKVYIYCTKQFYKKGDGYFQGKYCGKVIGEFVCRNIYDIECSSDDHNHFSENGTCLTVDEIRAYCNGETLYGWEISDLKIYDEPKELGEFFKYCGDIEKYLEVMNDEKDN